MNDTITFYYYTAWDGFAWQGCDEATAKSLQGYMEATETLPKSSADEFPFGGAMPCKIAGRIGVAVYRYMIRRKGDLFGRDSFYIALAFIPLGIGFVDFSALLELPQLSVPQPGELHPEEVSVEGLDLQLAGINEEPNRWLDSEAAIAEYRVLKGRSGLRKLSVLFFSKRTQLGFLTAVFKSDVGVDGVVSTQSYRVYSEVVDVLSASKSLSEARKAGGGVVDRSHEAARKMEEALRRLDEWCARQPGYFGLQEYLEEKKTELNDGEEKLRRISNFFDRLRQALEELPNDDRGCDRHSVERCAKLAEEIIKLPVVDYEAYKELLGLSMDVMRRSAKLLGRLELGHEIDESKRARMKTQRELETCQQELEDRRQEIIALKTILNDRNGGLGIKEKATTLGEKRHGFDSVILDCAKSSKKHKLSFDCVDWFLAICVALLLAALTYLSVKRFAHVRTPKSNSVNCNNYVSANNRAAETNAAECLSDKGTSSDGAQYYTNVIVSCEGGEEAAGGGGVNNNNSKKASKGSAK